MRRNAIYMGEEESNGSFLDTWARFPNIYDIYDTNDEDAMKFMKYCSIQTWNCLRTINIEWGGL